MSLADILAKKKAALGLPPAAPVTVSDPTNQLPPAPAEKPLSAIEKLRLKQAAAAAPAPAPQNITKEPAKPMTFAEKIKAQREASAAQAAAPATTSVLPDLAALESAPVNALPAGAIGTLQVAQTPAAPIPILSEDVSVQQAYADMRMKIDDLQDKMGDDLKSAMSDLKKGLMANPAACEIMLDEDVGNVVIALLRMTMQEVVSAKETGTGTGRKKKIKDLTADELLAGIDEL